MKLIALDVGTKRIGVAKADTNTKIAQPDGFIFVNGQEFVEIAKRARTLGTGLFVLGLPRSNEGNETQQSAYVRQFARQLAQTIPHAKIRFQDESLTSIEAERRLKMRKKSYDKGEVDAEAAAIILQDFIEQNSGANATQVQAAQSFTAAPQPLVQEQPIFVAKQPKTKKSKSKGNLAKRIVAIFLVAVVLIGLAAGGAYFWYINALQPIAGDVATCLPKESADCDNIKFTVKDNETIAQIADNLKSANLIKSQLAFKIYIRLSGQGSELKSGDYELNTTMSVATIVDIFVKGIGSSNVFNFTILPGETIADIRQKLIRQGYSEQEIDAALVKDYDHPVMQDWSDANGQPVSVRLEGYLFGETYEFYNGESVENIFIRAMDELWHVVEQNNLIAAYEAQGLTLREGIILASIVQKEAKVADQPGVARVFLNRIRTGEMTLGSDVTATYAVNLEDPERNVYTDNALVLAIDSPYNTRMHYGLPPGPISSPGASALLAVANPEEHSYRYFLTGDDGKMYYGYTEADHQQNINDHCQVLCNAEL